MLQFVPFYLFVLELCSISPPETFFISRIDNKRTLRRMSAPYYEIPSTQNHEKWLYAGTRMTSWHGFAFCVIGTLCGESTPGSPSLNTNNAYIDICLFFACNPLSNMFISCWLQTTWRPCDFIVILLFVVVCQLTLVFQLCIWYSERPSECLAVEYLEG